MNLIKLQFKKILAPISVLGYLFSFGVAYGAESIFDKTKGGLQNTINFAFGGGRKVKTGLDTGTDLFSGGIFVIINYLLTFVGLIFFLILLYGGYLWMFARGNEEQTEKAKKITREVIIGIIIIILARVIVEFILYQIGEAVKVQ